MTGSLAAAVGLRRPHVEVEAIFAERSGRAAVGFRKPRHLNAGVSKRSSLAHALPGGGGLGLTPAQFADRRRRERNALEDENAVLGDALDIAGLRFHDRCVLRVRMRGMAQQSDGQQRSRQSAAFRERWTTMDTILPRAGLPELARPGLLAAPIRVAAGGIEREIEMLSERGDGVAVLEIGIGVLEADDDRLECALVLPRRAAAWPSQAPCPRRRAASGIAASHAGCAPSGRCSARRSAPTWVAHRCWRPARAPAGSISRRRGSWPATSSAASASRFEAKPGVWRGIAHVLHHPLLQERRASGDAG